MTWQWQELAANHYRLTITGPRGRVQADCLAARLDSKDYVEYLYWEIIKCLKGYYHCCLTGHVDWSNDSV